MAAPYNGQIDQRADWYINFTYYTDETQTTPVNLTGYTAALQLRSEPTDATSVLSLSSGSGITITGASGLVAVHATAAQTRVIEEGYYYYDILLTSAGGIITRLVDGQMEVTAGVTR
jgi:hypothetical protein